MRGVVMYGPGDVRVEEREDPSIREPTDAIIRVTAACICGSDLWPYRGADKPRWPIPMGHEYVGVVEEVGDQVGTIKVGDFVVGSFFASDNTCEICQAGYQSRCVHAVGMGRMGTQAERLRVPLADGTLVAIPTRPTEAQERGLLAASDVLGTGWFGAVAAQAGPGKTVAVVGRLLCLAASRTGSKRSLHFAAPWNLPSPPRLTVSPCHWSSGQRAVPHLTSRRRRTPLAARSFGESNVSKAT